MQRDNLLYTFITHPVAMNILMVVFLIAGIVSLARMSVQFFPDINLDYARVHVSWPGASAEDVERSVTSRMELELKNTENLKDMNSTSSFSSSTIVLEFFPGTDISTETDNVKSDIERLVPDMPQDIERPVIAEIIPTEIVANVLLAGASIDQLRTLGNQFKDELITRGAGLVKIEGLPEEEISIQIPGQTLRDLGLSLNQIGERIRSHSHDATIGIMGRNDAGRELRVIDQRRSELSFENIPIIADSDGRLVTLADIAIIQRQALPDQISLFHKGQPAIILSLQRQAAADTLDSADMLYEWLAETQPKLPENVSLTIVDDRSLPLRDRIKVLLENGLAGLFLVLIVLYLFLNTRVAIWVACGIPVSLMGAIVALAMIDGSLDMLTLFTFIMTIGIIVDDAIVVGEESLTNFVQNPNPAEAVYTAARRMFMPILAASLTTMFAFMPVILVEGVTGQFLRSMAIVVIAVIAASLIEAFLILPGHLRHSFAKMRHRGQVSKKTFFDRQFEKFRESIFRNTLTAAVRHPITTIAISLACMILTVGLFTSGRMTYSFFPTPELNTLWANATFSAGTAQQTVSDYIQNVEQVLYETERDLGGNLIATVFSMHGTNTGEILGLPEGRGSHLGSVGVELVQSDLRQVRTTTFVREWRKRLEDVPGLENVTVLSQSAGPPGRDIEIRLSGGRSRFETKNAALALAEILENTPGVFGVGDNTNFGRQQQILTLTPLGHSLGLSIDEVSRQLRSSVDGLLVQSFTTEYADIEVNLSLPEEERNRLSEFGNIHIILSSGEAVPLLDVVSIETARGFDTLSSSMGVFNIEVAASVDPYAGNTTQIINWLETEIKPQITETFGVTWKVGARLEDQKATEESMKTGLMIALALIYLTLAWIFGSYAWPLIVMLAIPFGIVGAAWGHLILGLPITIISLLGMIGLSGIVINNAIVLVVFYKSNRKQGEEQLTAMINAGCQRLRPVILSNLTTIVGLLPLLFETSTQAQFLIPMAATLIFGLGFSSLLILFLIPAVLTFYEQIIERVKLSAKTGQEVESSSS